MNKLLNQIAKILIKKKLSLSVCESCTGGMLGTLITGEPGSSKYFCGGVIAYSDEVKQRVVGVRRATLRKYGAVSAEVAREMAQGVLERLKADISISITGIAGPTGGTKKKPVGLVYLCVATRQHVSVENRVFKGSRNQIRREACTEVLRLLKRLLGCHE
jgi:PncC family amidohydrolase